MKVSVESAIGPGGIIAVAWFKCYGSICIQGFIAINCCLLWFIIHSDWSLLLLVNTKGSFHCKQGMLLENMQSSLYHKQSSV